jgi:hypothetical protein
MQKVFFNAMKQFQGEYMGSILTAFLESMGARVRPDADDLMLSDEVYSGGVNRAVKDNDDLFPPEWRLSKSGRAQKAGPKPKTKKAQKG